jgi:hypothetical protein
LYGKAGSFISWRGLEGRAGAMRGSVLLGKVLQGKIKCCLAWSSPPMRCALSFGKAFHAVVMSRLVRWGRAGNCTVWSCEALQGRLLSGEVRIRIAGLSGLLCGLVWQGLSWYGVES